MSNKIWNDIFIKWIADFNAIDLLRAHDIIDNDEVAILKNNLLVDIIKTLESEVEEWNT